MPAKCRIIQRRSSGRTSFSGFYGSRPGLCLERTYCREPRHTIGSPEYFPSCQLPGKVTLTQDLNGTIPQTTWDSSSDYTTSSVASQNHHFTPSRSDAGDQGFS